MAQYREQIRATAQRNQNRSGWKQTFSTEWPIKYTTKTAWPGCLHKLTTA
jgi:hypothetical protein